MPVPGFTNPSRPKPYPKSLPLRPSVFRPHCLAANRLRHWIPVNAQPESPSFSAEACERLLDMLTHAYEDGTRGAYGLGLLVFHVFCDSFQPPVPEELRAPASEELVLHFLSSCAGAYSGKTLQNYFYGLRAWHLIHGVPWALSGPRMDTALAAVEKLAPPSAHRPKRPPFRVQDILKVREQLDLSDPLDAAVFACLTTTFWSASRLGEFTVPTLTSFDPARHVKRSNVTARQAVGRLNLPITEFYLPKTKCAPVTGETVFWAPQSGLANPEEALENHFHVNDPSADTALFSYRDSKGHLRPLTKPAFIKRMNVAATAAGLGNIQGHSLRIGAVLEYFLRGVPFEHVRVMGRWSSDAFLVYLHEHAMILALYIQDSPILCPFNELILPRPARAR